MENTAEAQRDHWRRLCREDAEAIRIAYGDGGRSLEMTLTSDGAVEVRAYGGPIYRMGAPMNTRSATVKVWLGQADPSDLHAQVLRALMEGPFPVSDQWYSPYPGEGPNRFRLHYGDEVAEMGTLSRMRDAHPSLKEVESALSYLGYRLSQEPASKTMANPDTDDWDTMDRPGPRWPLTRPIDPVPTPSPSSTTSHEAPKAGGSAASLHKGAGPPLGRDPSAQTLRTVLMVVAIMGAVGVVLALLVAAALAVGFLFLF
ncbi:MAG: hypothetical protein AAFX99_21430 [Myxococcota bacterium]